MGGGRKTHTLNVDSSLPTSEHGFISARNLRKSDLGGAIFGCKHATMTECLAKQLFGLPSPHFSYVRNIEAGLPLFLFNYSDRKLHGIYEAASHGQMHIDAYAWTNNSATTTSFPAQVRVRMKEQYKPLEEKQFRKVIVANYYMQQHFWFELDRSQTRSLIDLFKSVAPAVGRASCPPSQTIPFPALPDSKLKKKDAQAASSKDKNKFAALSLEEEGDI